MNNSESIFSIYNKTILIIGSSSNMAKPLISYLKKNKAKLILVDKYTKYKKIDNFYKADLSNKNDIFKVTKKIKKYFRNLDAVINFIGISDNKNFEKNFKVNVFSIHYIINSLIPILRKNKCSIVNITSLNSELGFSKNPGYNSSKGALKMLTKSMAVDLSKLGIRVNNIGPGYIRTKMTKKSYGNIIERRKRLSRLLIKRYGEPKDLIGPIIFLISNGSNYITGQDIYVDGGFLTKGI